MTLVKKETVKAKKFEKKMIGLIKMAKGMDMPENTRKILLDELRRVHNSCLSGSLNTALNIVFLCSSLNMSLVSTFTLMI